MNRVIWNDNGFVFPLQSLQLMFGAVCEESLESKPIWFLSLCHLISRKKGNTIVRFSDNTFLIDSFNIFVNITCISCLVSCKHVFISESSLFLVEAESVYLSGFHVQ